MEAWFFWLLFVIGVGLVWVIYFGWLKTSMRYPLLFMLNTAVIVSIFWYGLEMKYLGINMPNLRSFLVYGLITLSAYLIGKGLELDKKLNIKGQEVFNEDRNLWFYLVLSIPLQELMTRGYVLAVFKHFRWESLSLFVLFSAFIFSFMHLFLKNNYLMLATLAMGIIWAITFYFYPDLVMISLSHFVLGASMLGMVASDLIDSKAKNKGLKAIKSA